MDHRGSIYYTYERNYFAAKCVGWVGWLLDLITAILGGILIYLLRANGGAQSSVYLVVVILISSLLNSFYGPKLRSRDYYKAGQEHQRLYDKFDHFIHFQIGNTEVDGCEIVDKLDQLNTERHDLNQSTPQLGGIWYYAMENISKAKHIYRVTMPWKTTKDWERERFEDVVPEDRPLSDS